MPRHFRPSTGLLLLCLLACCGAGCAHHHSPVVSDDGVLLPDNPIVVPPVDQEYLWQQIVDTLDDYFRIEREDRIRLIGGVLTEGRIDTYPVAGATLLEPWRRDSTHGFERLHSTLQSTRRRAHVRVMPDSQGYSLEVVVIKELEDVNRPEHATVGAATFRHDGTLVRTDLGDGARPVTLGWIPLGRDISLEQKILSQIQGRLAEAPTAVKPTQL